MTLSTDFEMTDCPLINQSWFLANLSAISTPFNSTNNITRRHVCTLLQLRD